MRVARTEHVDPGEARAQLLGEHDQLRALIEDALDAASRPNPAELHQAIERLRRAFTLHNRNEEALLVPILSAEPTWGALRVARMVEEHHAEHAALCAMLDGSDNEVALRLADIAEEIDAHMAAEERTFLSPQVLHR